MKPWTTNLRWDHFSYLFVALTLVGLFFGTVFIGLPERAAAILVVLLMGVTAGCLWTDRFGIPNAVAAVSFYVVAFAVFALINLGGILLACLKVAFLSFMAPFTALYGAFEVTYGILKGQ